MGACHTWQCLVVQFWVKNMLEYCGDVLYILIHQNKKVGFRLQTQANNAKQIEWAQQQLIIEWLEKYEER